MQTRVRLVNRLLRCCDTKLSLLDRGPHTRLLLGAARRTTEPFAVGSVSPSTTGPARERKSGASVSLRRAQKVKEEHDLRCSRTC